MKETFLQNQKTQLIDKKEYTYQDVVSVMQILRGDNGCPWDRAQTHRSIRENAIEEAYELCAAIDKGDVDNLIEELGDMLLQCVLHIQIAQDENEFTATDVYNCLCRKLISRHTHIFGGDVATSSSSALATWEANKVKEHKYATTTEYLKAVPASMTALLRAAKVQHRAAKVGFDWDDANGAIAKTHEEFTEVIAAIESQKADDIEEEFGDLLFSIVNVMRFFDVNGEVALSRTTQKFISRFEYVERKLAERGKKPADSNLAEMDELWNEAKTALRK